MKHAAGWTLARIGKTALTLAAAAIGAAMLLGSSCNLTNKAPTVPVISGPSAGVVAVPVTFTATATDPENDSVWVQFDWGDSSILTWYDPVASGETKSVSHFYMDPGTYSVKARARDAKGKESGWCTAESIHISSIVRDYPDSVYAEIPILSGGDEGAITPDGAYLYVTSCSDTSWKVTPIRLADRTALPPISLAGAPRHIVSSVDGSHMYVTLSSDTVVSIRTSDNLIDYEVPVDSEPWGIATTPDGQYLLVTVRYPEPGYLLYLRTADLSAADTVSFGEHCDLVVADRTGVHGYLGMYSGIRVLDIAARTLVDSIPAVLNPGLLALSPDGRFLYVTCWDEEGIAVVRLEDKSVAAFVNSYDSWMGSIATTHNGRYLMYTRYRDMQYVDTQSYAAVDSLALPGESRRTLVMHPTADTVYMVGWKKVYVIGPR